MNELKNWLMSKYKKKYLGYKIYWIQQQVFDILQLNLSKQQHKRCSLFSSNILSLDQKMHFPSLPGSIKA